MKTPFLNRKSKGFTLIELLVVIAIILTLAGIAMTVVNGVMEKSTVTTATATVCRRLWKITCWTTAAFPWPGAAGK